MKNKKNNDYRIMIMLIILILVLVCGVTGLMIDDHYSFFNALFATLSMFSVGFDNTTSSILVNIARFGALIFSATVIYNLIKKSFQSLKDYINSKKKDSIFVLGSGEIVNDFIKSTDCKCINSDYYIDTNKYVLLGEDQDNLDFYNKYKEELENKDVYIKNSVFANTTKGYIRYFSIEELTAKRFFEENSLMEYAMKDGKFKQEFTISLVGFNNLAENVLFKSLNINIFDTKQVVNYKLFGDTKEFSDTHINKEELHIKCFEGSIFSNKKEIENSDVLLFFGNDDELVKLTCSLTSGNIYYFTTSDLAKELFNDNKYGGNGVKIKTYNYLENICTYDNIVNEAVVEAAKLANYGYNTKHPEYGATGTIEEQWNSLNTFLKLNNIMTTDYFVITTTKLIYKELGKEVTEISKDEWETICKSSLMELEHLRWNNYHYYCNWTYDNIKSKDKQRKKHQCLVRFSELTEEDKLKDFEIVYVIKNYVLDGKIAFKKHNN